MRVLTPLFNVIYGTIAAVFFIASVTMVAMAVWQLWDAIGLGSNRAIVLRAAGAIEGIGLLAVALMALEISQTVIEEEILRRVHVSAPTRVRRYISRFLVVVVVALSIESLVGVVQSLHEDPAHLPHAAAVSVGAALLLAAWGLFVKLNRSVEELEPEGVEEARREDSKVSEQ
jgi:hypothetical protein